MAKPITGPSTSTFATSSVHPPTPEASSLARAIRISNVGRTTISFVPASMLRACLTEAGMRSSLTTSRSTTGSVEAKMVPRSSASITEISSKKYEQTAMTATVTTVPGPSDRMGTNPAPPMPMLPMRTASRHRTKASVTVATVSSNALSGPKCKMPRRPSRNPRPRKTIGNEIGARSTKPEVRPAMVKTTATSAKPASGSGKPVALSSARNAPAFDREGGPDPILLPRRVVEDPFVAHLLELASLLPGGQAIRVHAVDDDLRALVRQHPFGLVHELVGEVDRAGQVGAGVVLLGERLDQHEFVPAVHLRLQLFPRNNRCHLELQSRLFQVEVTFDA